MSYIDSPRSFASLPWPHQHSSDNAFSISAARGNGSPPSVQGLAATSHQFRGEALARDPWMERYGAWIVLSFSIAFTLFLLLMELAGQTPGKSLVLKSFSDIFQFVGEGIGFLFCLRTTIRLRNVAMQATWELADKERGPHTPNDLVLARAEARSTRCSYLAWMFLALAIALYASGQAVWTSYDVRMSSASVPFPGLYDIGFVMSYPFFLIGTLLLTRRSQASVSHARLLLDALGVIGTALAVSWFFLFTPLIAGLAQQPGFGAAFLSIYFPTGDLFLVAVGTLLMFSPLSHRSQQPVFLCLCLGLLFLAITDSLLAYYNLSFSFNTGTLQDVLWPLSMLLIGLAAIEYPRSIAHEQEQEARSKKRTLYTVSRPSQIVTTVQTIAPFILVLMTCTMLLTVVAPHGGSMLVQADITALALILIVIIRQALTLIENTRLTMQMRGELVISRRELQTTRREADEATRTMQEKRLLEEGIARLQEVHARVARGDLTARAPSVPGPLLPIAISLNLMLDRLSSLSKRGASYQQLLYESQLLQTAVERMGQGLPAWPPEQSPPQSGTELSPLFLGLLHLQRFHEGQWRRLSTLVEPMGKLLRQLRESLTELQHSSMFRDLGQARFERMILERVTREVGLLDQQQRDLSHQMLLVSHTGSPSNHADARYTPAPPSDPTLLQQIQAPPRRTGRLLSSLQSSDQG